MLSHGPIQDDASARAAVQIDKIRRGASPAEVPVERMQRTVLVVNLRTAKAIGVTIPQSLLLRADEAME